jgi:hypothetical protein
VDNRGGAVVKRFILLAGGTLAFFVVPMAARRARVATLDEPKTVDNVSIDGDIDRSEVPVAFMGQLLGGTGISGGFAQLEGCSSAPALHVTAKKGMTIREVMDSFVTENLAYRWHLDGGVVNLMPRAGLALLDARIRNFRLNTTDQQMSAGAVLYDLIRLPEVRQQAAELKLQPGIMQGGPGVVDEHPAPRKPVPIVVNLNDVSLREAFNSVARAYEHTIWTYFERDCDGAKTYVIGASTPD